MASWGRLCRGGTSTLPLFAFHQLGHCRKNLPLEPLLSVSRFTHLQLPVALRRSEHAGRGAGELRPAYVVVASGPSAIPGVVAAPPLPKRCLNLAAAPQLRHSKKGKEGRRGMEKWRIGRNELGREDYEEWGS